MISKQKTNILLCAGALFLGGLIYILFRSNTYVARLFNQVCFIQQIRGAIARYPCDFLKYYFPDYLWSFALGCGLCAIFADSVKKAYFCGIVAAAYGILWEALQYLCIIGGTGDVWDMLMYFLAGISCIIINLRREL